MLAGTFLVMGALVVAVVVGRGPAARAGIPDAAVAVLAGVAAAFVPGIAEVRLSPDVLLMVLLPPLIYFAAFFSDPRETVRNIVPVLGQAVGLVLVTAVAVAATLLALFPDVGWAAALVFGAVVAPPDPVAASTVLQRLGVPHRMITVLEGEGLVNDGVALTLFALALGGIGATPSVGDVAGSIALEVGGGVGIGLVVGVLITAARRGVRDKSSQVVVSLLTPFLAFIPAQELHASGVLATATAAVWLGLRGRGVVPPTARVQSETFWQVLNLLLVTLLFVLVGLQVPRLFRSVGHYPAGTLILASVALVAVTVLVRVLWVMLTPGVVRALPGVDSRERLPWRERLAVGWCGPRGAVSLAVALSIPAVFPRRDLVLFLTVVVILATLVGQVLTLPVVVRRLRLGRTEQQRTEALHARRLALDAALRELDGAAADEEIDDDGADALRQLLELRRDRLHSAADPAEQPGRGGDHHGLRIRLLTVERGRLQTLYERGEISRRTLIDISQEIDLDETRLRTAD